MTVFVSRNYGNIVFVLLLLTLAIIHFYQYKLLVYTGDEPRFTYYSYSIFKGETLKYPLDKFSFETGSLSPAHVILNMPLTINIFNKNMFMMNSIIAPLLYSPVLFLGSAYKAWELLRTAAFLYYCGGLLFIWLSLRTLFSIRESILSLSMVTLSVPQLVQMSLGNTEQIAIFFLAAAIYYLIFRPVSYISVVIGAISICLVVMSSMRSMPLAMFVSLGFVGRVCMMVCSENINKFKTLLLYFTLTACGTVVWIIMQISFTGTISGSSLLNETLSDKSMLWFMHRLYIPLFHHKDGIFLLFPLIFASFLGLAYAAWNRSNVAIMCLGSWVAYYCIISITGQSEGYPARLQFVLVEFFVFGLAFYLRNFKNFTSKLVLIVGVICSILIDYFHLVAPTVLLLNRQFGLFQQFILSNIQYFDLGRYIIWDQHSIWTQPSMPLFLQDTFRIANNVLAFLVLISFLLWLSIASKLSNLNKRICVFFAITIIVGAVLSFIVLPVSENKIDIVRHSIGEQQIVKLNFKKPIKNKMVITLGLYPFWQSPEYPSFFRVNVSTINGKILHYNKRSMPEIRLYSADYVKSIEIVGDKAHVAWNALPMRVYLYFI